MISCKFMQLDLFTPQKDISILPGNDDQGEVMCNSVPHNQNPTES